MIPRELKYIHTVAEDMFRAYTCKDWRRYLNSKEELREMMVRLELKAQIDRHIQANREGKGVKDPGASPADFWGF